MKLQTTRIGLTSNRTFCIAEEHGGYYKFRLTFFLSAEGRIYQTGEALCRDYVTDHGNDHIIVSGDGVSASYQTDCICELWRKEE